MRTSTSLITAIAAVLLCSALPLDPRDSRAEYNVEKRGDGHPIKGRQKVGDIFAGGPAFGADRRDPSPTENIVKWCEASAETDLEQGTISEEEGKANLESCSLLVPLLSPSFGGTLALPKNQQPNLVRQLCMGALSATCTDASTNQTYACKNVSKLCVMLGLEILRESNFLYGYPQGTSDHPSLAELTGSANFLGFPNTPNSKHDPDGPDDSGVPTSIIRPSRLHVSPELLDPLATLYNPEDKLHTACAAAREVCRNPEPELLSHCQQMAVVCPYSDTPTLDTSSSSSGPLLGSGSRRPWSGFLGSTGGTSGADAFAEGMGPPVSSGKGLGLHGVTGPGIKTTMGTSLGGSSTGGSAIGGEGQMNAGPGTGTGTEGISVDAGITTLSPGSTSGEAAKRLKSDTPLPGSVRQPTTHDKRDGLVDPSIRVKAFINTLNGYGSLPRDGDDAYDTCQAMMSSECLSNLVDPSQRCQDFVETCANYFPAL